MAIRTYTDPDGVRWEVFAVRRSSPEASAVRPGLEGGWLCFQSSAGKFRLGDYPSDWAELDDLALGRLREGALRADPTASRWFEER